MKFPILMMALFLASGCDFNGQDAGEVQLEEGQSAELEAPTAIAFPDTSTWPGVIERASEFSFKQQPALCVPSKREYRDTVGYLEPNKNAQQLSRTYYVKPGSGPAAAEIELQLDLLVRRGLLTTTPVTVENTPLVGFQLSSSGWGHTASDRGRSLCFATGITQVNHITDYTLIADQGSGLKAYQVDYEYGPRFLDWFDPELRAASIGYKLKLPALGKALLIEGPNGYFFATQHVRDRLPRPPLPTLEQATALALGSGVIEKLCPPERCGNHGVTNFHVISVSASSRGRSPRIKYAYSLGSRGTMLGSGMLGRDSEGNWTMSKSITSEHSQTLEEIQASD